MRSECLRIERVSKSFAGLHALKQFNCSVRRGEILGVIGPNGAGKTTLFNVLTGLLRADDGHAWFRGVDLLRLGPYKTARLGVARTFQRVRLIGEMSVLENVLLAFPRQRGERMWNAFVRRRENLETERANAERADELLRRLDLQDKRDALAGHLSYGQQKMLSFARCIAAEGELLLLDEPVAGIARGTLDRILKMILTLAGEGRTIVLIEHNLDAVAQVCKRVVFMDSGAVMCEGTPEEIRGNPDVLTVYLG